MHPMIPENQSGSRAQSSASTNWLDGLNNQISFYKRSNERKRLDHEFDWQWLENFSNGKWSVKKFIKSFLQKIGLKQSSRFDYQDWMNNNAARIWNSRELLEDELSKLMFDSVLVLKSAGYKRFFFPRINFDDFVSVVGSEPFISKELPQDYLGIPLRVFRLQYNHEPEALPLRLVATGSGIDLINRYQQYFFVRDNVRLMPASGDVVLDCGACIGEISVLFAGLVGKSGEVHLFDPVPLHNKFCDLQASLNSDISQVFKINKLAVGDVSAEVTGSKTDEGKISPGAMTITSFSMTSLDDYVASKKLSRVKFKPCLAISGYHKPEDLWEIPEKLKMLNGKYKIYFGHHTPMNWESVFYAGE